MFTEDQHDLIADVLANTRPPEPAVAAPLLPGFDGRRTAQYLKHREIVDEMANMLEQDNPEFDWSRFIAATEV